MEKVKPLPAPEMLLMTRHDDYSFAHEIERHIRFFEKDQETGLEIDVALPMEWVRHVYRYRHSKMPTCYGIVTLPLMLRDGTLLATRGLDRKRGILFMIPQELTAILPKPDQCDDSAVAAAMRYLIDEWLCDVSASYPVKCMIVASALTVIERMVLPERPAFFVTAAKRGGGKTTVMHMITSAATGHRMPACGWSPNAEERRKALFAYLAEGPAVVCWDNITKGSTLSCPSVEKSLTSFLYSDRVLGKTETRTVPATTIQFFTGNNIAPKGDMASRSLTIMLQVDRPDPENRFVKHEDPIAWTMKHRGEILSALYTILLGNPQLQGDKTAPPAQTRFKTWWSIVGSAVEHAARLCGNDMSFRALLSANEENNEEEHSLAELLRTLEAEQTADAVRQGSHDNKKFTASDVIRWMTTNAMLRPLIERACGDGKAMPETVTATTITWRLKSVAFAPTMIEQNRITQLKYEARTDERRHHRDSDTGLFWVEDMAVPT